MKKSFIFLAFFTWVFIFGSGCSHSASKPEPATAAQASVQGFDAELTNYPYPYPVQFHQFESQRQNLKMAYMDVASEKPNGRTVVLLHGKNFSGAYWAQTIQFLSQAGFRVIVPDQIGFGKSTKPQAYQFSLHGLASNTHSLLAKLGVQKAVVIGHSMGGMLASRYTLMYPNEVERLIMVSPIGLEDWKTMTSYRTIDEIFQQELRATPESIKEYQRQSYFGGEWKPEYDKLVEILAGWTQHPDYPKVAWNSALTSDMIFTQPVVYEFPLIRVPTLLVIGLRDKTAIGKAWASEANKAKMGDYTKLGKRASRAIKGAKLVEIPASGHLPQIETFDVYRKAITDFLR